MKEIDIINNIKQELFNKVKKQYDEYSLNNTPVNKEKYIRLLKQYKNINKCKTISEIKECLKNIQTEIKDLKQLYDKKIEEYKKDRTNKQLEREYKEIVIVAQVLTDAFSEIRVAISQYKKTVKPNIEAKFKDAKPKTETLEEKKEEQLNPKKEEQLNPKKEEQLNSKKEKIVIQGEKKTTVKKEEKQPAVKKYIDGINFNLEPIRELQQINGEILSLREELVGLDVKSEEAKELRKKIVDLCSRREQIAFEANEYDGINLVKQVESLEVRYAKAPAGHGKIEKEFNAEEYNKLLIEKITILGDILFYGSSSTYMNLSLYPTETQRKEAFNKILEKHKTEYINLITSVYGTQNPIIYKDKEKVKTAFCLIKQLGQFNLRGNYHDFKQHHKDGKLNNEAISREMYNEGIKEIEKLMNSFRVLSTEAIRQKGGTVKVSFDAITKEELKQEIDKKMVDLYRKVCDKNKAISM